MTIQTAFDSFMIDQQIKGNSSKTLKYYDTDIGMFLAFMGQDFRLDELTFKQLQQYYMFTVERSLSSTTVQSYIRAVRVFLSWCYREDYLQMDFTTKFRLPKAKRKTIDILTDNEVKILFKVLAEHRTVLRLRDRCICALMLDSGLRKGEVVTLATSRLHVVEGYAIVDGKGNKQRSVPLGLFTRKCIMQYLSKRPDCERQDAFFLTNNGSPITDNTVKQMFHRLKEDTLIPRIRPHLLRHTFATRFLENGGDIYTLQQILGHSSLEMVKKYVHLTSRETVKNFTNYSPLDNLF